ncbi:MAG TPA: TMEM165/GDT1 family protein [Steroidobacteraceae bacterium]|nr:TMEM165/GDT1 family protein [Steroidobacteraceae bacterium]
MEAFLISAATIALAEIGDKTQLLALVLASRYRRPGPVITGILVATLISHAIAGAIGTWALRILGPAALRWLLAASFFAMAVWILIPDRRDERAERATARFGVLGTTIVAFFLAEMGDKTQIATMALAAKYASFYAVVAGTTTGMMLANVPAVLIGDRLAGRTPTRLVHAIAALIFAGLGLLVLVGSGGGLLDWLPAAPAPGAK